MRVDKPAGSDLLRAIDHALIRPGATYADVRRLCLEVRHYGLGGIVLLPVHCERAAGYLRGLDIRFVAAVGFPNGAFTTDGKVFEARDAIAHGATAIEYVVDVGALLSGHRDLVAREMAAMRAATDGRVLRATLETSVLPDEAVRFVCASAAEAGIDFVVSSTGFADAEVTAEDVRLLNGAAGPRVGVCAAGGIRTLDAARALVDAGAKVLRTFDSVAIAEELTDERDGEDA